MYIRGIWLVGFEQMIHAATSWHFPTLEWEWDVHISLILIAASEQTNRALKMILPRSQFKSHIFAGRLEVLSFSSQDRNPSFCLQDTHESVLHILRTSDELLLYFFWGGNGKINESLYANQCNQYMRHIFGNLSCIPMSQVIWMISNVWEKKASAETE